MKAGLIAICLTFVLGASDVRAITVLGSGAVSCGQWLDGEQKGLRTLDISWVLGYLTGLNVRSSTDFLKGYESKGIAAAIDKFCRENPLKNVDAAANDVADQMIRMRK